MAEFKVGDFVSWNSSGGRAKGKITKKITDGSRVPDIEPDITGTKEDPAYQIRVYRDNEPSDVLVGHKAGALTKIEPIESDKSLDELDPEEIALRDEDNKERNEVYYKYHATVNMSASELESWSENECSKKASVSRAPIKRNLELLRTKKEDWTSKHIRWANRTISFVNRMKGNDAGEPAADGCPSKKTISLKNWAFDPGKGSNKSMDNLDAIAQQVKEQSEAIESLRSSIEDVFKFQVSAIAESDEEVDKDDPNFLDTHIGIPTPAQMEAIRRVTAIDSQSEDWLVVPFHASNTLVDSSERRWHPSVMFQMAETAVGRCLMVNHSWSDVTDSFGTIIDAKICRDIQVDPYMLTGVGAEELNKEIIENEGGMLWLYLCAAIPANSQMAEAVRTRQYQDTSTGSLLRDPFYLCPNCQREMGREVSFMEYTLDARGRRQYTCNHLIPSPFMRSLTEAYAEEGEEFQFADYATLGGSATEFLEHSLVVKGALPRSSVIRELDD
jgi:hypothetical protein